MECEKEAWQVNIHCNNKLTDLSMQGGEVVSVGIQTRAWQIIWYQGER